MLNWLNTIIQLLCWRASNSYCHNRSCCIILSVLLHWVHFCKILRSVWLLAGGCHNSIKTANCRMTLTQAPLPHDSTLNASNRSPSTYPIKFSQLPNLHTFITSSPFTVLEVLALYPSLLLLCHRHYLVSKIITDRTFSYASPSKFYSNRLSQFYVEMRWNG